MTPSFTNPMHFIACLFGGTLARGWLSRSLCTEKWSFAWSVMVDVVSVIMMSDFEVY